MNTKPKTNKNGVWQVLLDKLSERVGELVTNDELIKASGQHNYARRIRELRAEGWDVKYIAHQNGYILHSTEKKPYSADEYINLKLRQKVLERDGYTCQLCGHKAKSSYGDGAPVRLEVDHIVPLHNQGKTVEENLWTLCSRCNAGKKSLLAYPETVKNKIVSLNLPDDLRLKVSNKAIATGQSVNGLLVEAIRRGLE